MENTTEKGLKAYLDDLMNPPKNYVMSPELKKKLIKMGIDAVSVERRIRINVLDRFVSWERWNYDFKERSERCPVLYGDNKRKIKYNFRKAS